MQKTYRFKISLLALLISQTTFGLTEKNKIQMTNNKLSQLSAKQLFNGTNLEGWKHVGNGNFTVENGQLKTQGGMGLLWYAKQKFSNVHMSIVYKTTYPDSNSGVFVRIANTPKDPWDAVHHGYEIQICDEGNDAFDDYHRTGAIYSLSKAQTFASKPPGEWNQYDIELRKEKILVWLNGIKINEFDPISPSPARKQSYEPMRGPRPLSGYIGIQNHDHNATHKDSHVYFKEITISPLEKSQ